MPAQWYVTYINIVFEMFRKNWHLFSVKCIHSNEALVEKFYSRLFISHCLGQMGRLMDNWLSYSCLINYLY